LVAVPGRVHPHPRRQLGGDVDDDLVERDETLRDRAAHPVRTLDRPHPIREAGDRFEHRDEPVVAVLEPTPREHRLVSGQDRDRVRRLVRIHPDDHLIGHCCRCLSRCQ
jgi:hypothetical protein